MLVTAFSDGFLWEAHRYHHAATTFTVLTGNRIRALDEVCRQFIILIPLTLLGVFAPMYIAGRYGFLAFDMLQPSMVPWTYGWFGRWVVYSPVGHRLHHSHERDHWDCHYGDILVIWDRLFGTWYAGDRVNASVDVSDNPYNARAVLVEYLNCAARCARLCELRSHVALAHAVPAPAPPRWRHAAVRIDR